MSVGGGAGRELLLSKPAGPHRHLIRVTTAARGKLEATALRALSGEVAADMEQAADATWLWKGHLHPKLIDGFTFTMPDTPKNQAQYPQPASQKPGVGLPIARSWWFSPWRPPV